jgi:hypothetical protein
VWDATRRDPLPAEFAGLAAEHPAVPPAGELL